MSDRVTPRKLRDIEARINLAVCDLENLRPRHIFDDKHGTGGDLVRELFDACDRLLAVAGKLEIERMEKRK